MEIKRTANAGVLLTLDGVRILLDGVNQPLYPYLGTPPKERQMLLNAPPELVAFTHRHPDHCDTSFVSDYLQNAAGPVLGPADVPCSSQEAVQLGTVWITPVQSRHVGKTDCRDHRSYLLQGSKCVWFMGDASVLHWQKSADFPKPDVLIAPYGFLLGRGWEYCKSLQVDAVVVLHLPDRRNDPYGLWDALAQTLSDSTGPEVIIPAMGEQILLYEPQKC